MRTNLDLLRKLAAIYTETGGDPAADPAGVPSLSVSVPWADQLGFRLLDGAVWLTWGGVGVHCLTSDQAAHGGKVLAALAALARPQP